MSKRPVPSPPSTPPASLITGSLSTQTSPLPQSRILAPEIHTDDQRNVTPPELPESSGLYEEGSPHPVTFTPENAPQTSNPQWLMPTSAELAFLASLPTPTVRVDDGSSATDDVGQESLGRISPSQDKSEATSEATSDAATAAALPLSSVGDIFSAASKRYTSTHNGNVYHRSDTWAVGEKWGRHIRVIDVGSETMGGGKRKSSC